MEFTKAQKTIITRLLNNAKGRANNANGSHGGIVAYTLTREWLEEMLVAQGHVCPRTEIDYEYEEYKSWHKRSGHPARPSINRLNPSKGYTPDNCEVVSNFYNTMLSSWTRPEVMPHLWGAWKNMVQRNGTWKQKILAWFLP